MIVFDLDGTLRNTKCSDHLVPKDVTKAKNWLDWQHHVNAHGTPIENICDFYRECCTGVERVVIFTSSQFGTLEWLISNNLPMPRGILERSPIDNRSPIEHKIERVKIFQENISLWVDDSKSVCDFAKGLGITVNHVTESNWDVVHDNDIEFPIYYGV